MQKKREIHTMSDKTSDIVLVVVTALIMLIIAYPLYYIVIASISDPVDVYAGKVFLLPAKVTMDGYKRILEYESFSTEYSSS